tara:strand:+ start:437 stop:871 length:435 start_codon:yes stop_codon:yes gene_type:complete
MLFEFSNTESPTENCDPRDTWCSVDVGIGHSWVPRYLPRSCISSELQDILIDLPETRSSDGFTVGETTTVRVDRESAADLGLPPGDDLFLITVPAQAVLGHVHDLCARLRVLQLGKVHIGGTDSRHLEGGERRVDSWAFGTLDC